MVNNSVCWLLSLSEVRCVIGASRQMGAPFINSTIAGKQFGGKNIWRESPSAVSAGELF